MSKMALHEPFGHLQPKLWAKEGSKLKLAVWLLTTKSRDWPFPDIRWQSATWRWKALKESYNFGLDLVSIGLCNREIWAPKFPGLQPGTISGLLLGSLGKKSHLDVASTERCKVYYMGEGGAFPQVWAVVSQVCQSVHGLSQHPRVFPNVN
jgi:hypothetical protein